MPVISTKEPPNGRENMAYNYTYVKVFTPYLLLEVSYGRVDDMAYF